MTRALTCAVLLLLSGVAGAAPWPGPDPSPAPWEETRLGVERSDLAVGEGAEAVEGAVVEVHYTGMLGDGSIFDSSVSRGKPFSFRIGAGQVIKGWEDGVQGMKEGGKRRLVIPPELGYGNRAAGPIPPGSTLYFEIELLRVVEAPPPRAEGPQSLPAHAFKQSRSGLAWADVHKGDGPRPKSGKRVCVAYTAWTEAGEPLDDTRGRGRCWWFRYDHERVIAGLTEGLKTMRQGGVRQLRMPAALLAGEAPNGRLSADGTVIFEVTLVEATR